MLEFIRTDRKVVPAGHLVVYVLLELILELGDSKFHKTPTSGKEYS